MNRGVSIKNEYFQRLTTFINERSVNECSMKFEGNATSFITTPTQECRGSR